MSGQREKLMPAWLRDITSPYTAHAAAAIALGVIAFGCAALLMFASGYLISKTAQPSTTLFAIMIPVACVQLFGIGRPLARYLERLVSHDWVFRITSSLRAALFRAVNRKAGDPGASRATGEYLDTLAGDIGHLQNLYLRVAFPAIVAFALLVAACLVCAAFSPAIGVALLVSGVIASALLPAAALLIARPLVTSARQRHVNESAAVTDDIMGALDWSLSGRSTSILHVHADNASAVADGERRVRRLTRAFELASAIVLAFALCVITVLAASGFSGDTESVNYIAAFAIGFFPLIEVFMLLPGAAVDSLGHRDALSRLDGLVANAHGDHLPETLDPESANIAFAKPASIDFDNVTYTYPLAPHRALDQLSVSIPARQSIAVLGRSGAGKSTLASLLRGELEPSEGIVMADGEASDARTLRTLVGYVPQTPYIFDRTLRENLAIAKPDATDDQIVEALENVGLGSKLASLEDGLDTPVGETGIGFSGGEAHRLALARILLARYEVVVLDEPFASLDPATEAALVDTLFESFADKTLVVITHHLAHIERFDRVMFIEEGRVTIDGTPDELMKKEPAFRELLQFDRGTGFFAGD